MGTDQIKPFSFTSLGTPGSRCAALGLSLLMSQLNKLPRADGEVGEEGKSRRLGQAGAGEGGISLIRVKVTIPWSTQYLECPAFAMQTGH